MTEINEGKKLQEQQYLDVLQLLLDKAQNIAENKMQHGPQDVPAVNIGLTRMTFDLSDGTIPLITTRETSFKNIVVELLWFLSGESRVDFLHEYGAHFWDDWASKKAGEKYGLEQGDVGRIYGPNWIRWPTTEGEEINQIEWVINGIKKHPQWRRWFVTAWNPEFIDKAFLAPCHGTFHLTMVDEKLNLHHFQRSGDFPVGVPYNIASYAILLRMICQVTGKEPGLLEQITSDTHMYINQAEAVQEQLKRKPYPFPKMQLVEKSDIFAYSWPKDFELIDYRCHPHIKMDVAL